MSMKSVHFTTIIASLTAMVLMAEAGTEQDGPNRPSDACLSGVTMVDTKGRDFRVMPAAGSTRVLLMYNGYTCRECLIGIDSLLDVISRENRAADVLLVSRATSRDVFRIRDAIDHARALEIDRPIAVDLPDSGVVDPWPPDNLHGGAFGCFGVTRTPAMVIVDAQAGVHFFPYAALTSIDSGLAERIRGALFGSG